MLETSKKYAQQTLHDNPLYPSSQIKPETYKKTLLVLTRSISKRNNMLQLFKTKKDSEIISCEEDFSFSNMDACPLIRDAGDNYKALERHFGVLTAMMAFGQSCLLNPEPKFFNAIALSDTVVLSLMKSDF